MRLVDKGNGQLAFENEKIGPGQTPVFEKNMWVKFAQGVLKEHDPQYQASTATTQNVAGARDAAIDVANATAQGGQQRAAGTPLK